MGRHLAKFLGQVIGVLIIISMVRNYRAAWNPIDYLISHHGLPPGETLGFFAEWCLCMIGGICLAFRLWFGFWLMAAAFVVQCLGYALLFLPFVKHFFNGQMNSTEAYYAVNLPLLLVLAILQYAGRKKPAPAAGT